MTSRTLIEAARAEHTAEANRKTAETRWRAAWWATTIELARVGDRGDVTAALDSLEDILGQNRSYLSKRRVTGQALAALEGDGLDRLPPRLAMEYVNANGSPADAVRYLTEAEASGISLRDMAAALGTQPKSWLREDEQGQRPVTPAEAGAALAALPPAARAEFVRDALADPEVADAAFNRTDAQQPGVTQAALGNVAQAHHQGEIRRQAERIAAMPEPARETDEAIGRVGAKLDLDEQTLAFKTACRTFTDAMSAALPQAGPYSGGTGPMSYASLVSQTAEAHGTAGRLLAILGEYVTSGQPGSGLDDELAQMLGGH